MYPSWGNYKPDCSLDGRLRVAWRGNLAKPLSTAEVRNRYMIRLHREDIIPNMINDQPGN